MIEDKFASYSHIFFYGFGCVCYNILKSEPDSQNVDIVVPKTEFSNMMVLDSSGFDTLVIDTTC